ncbi:sodium-dependent proline transporter-like isoform X1 [Ruditapes philippinarum]|uniref:sodium-dependent proline transporter-like isoform X1 n=1 Tax=Ruditapes philippinarum TaxID=129788 RepID=UPI00295A7EF9|nr:sodium-dependent proline transporter-like isoform X1 [Ruditapes philippinarum]
MSAQEYRKDDRSIEDRLAHIETQNNAIIDALQKKHKKHIFIGLEDENEERGNWSGRFDFFLSCLGYAVGLGNVWRFPYLCYKNGGGAFFIPYVIMLAFVGMPIFFLELSLGQFSSSGPLTCWKYAPLFQGVGVGMVAVSAMVAIYYNMIIGWSLYYLFASFTSELPWEKCDPEWATEMCLDYIKKVDNAGACEMMEYHVNRTQGACYNKTTDKIAAIFDLALAKDNGIERQLPSEQYFERKAIGNAFSDGLGDLGPMRWQMVLCYLLAFILVVLALSKSIKSSGKVVYFTATFPYIVLVILFVRGLMLDGYKEGIEFYITPKTDRLTDSVIWKDAAVQIFFSLSASWGGLIALSSYNRFHNDCLRDAIAVSLGNCLTSVFAGFVIFSYLGNMSHELGVPIEDVARSGASLAFTVYPYAVTLLPASPFWAIIFFLMLLTLGVDSQFVLVETVTTALMDRFIVLRKYKLLTVMVLCAIFFLLGLTLTTNGGIYMLEVMDTYSGGWNIMFIAICECISLCYVYGIRRFLVDIETMIGYKVCGFCPFIACKYWWALNWCVISPVIVLATMIFSWVKYTDMEGDEYPEWSDALGWLMTLTVIVAIIGGALLALCSGEGSFTDRLRQATTPTVEWGPALVKHRSLVAKYVPGFVVDPWGKGGEVAPDDIKLQMKEPSQVEQKTPNPSHTAQYQAQTAPGAYGPGAPVYVTYVE